MDRLIEEIMAEYPERTQKLHVSSVESIEASMEQYKSQRLALIRAINNTPELFFENPDVGQMFVDFVQTVDMLVPKAADSYYDLLNKSDIRHLKPKDVCDIHPDPISFYSELKMWLNVKFGADPSKAVRDMFDIEEKLRNNGRVRSAKK